MNDTNGRIAEIIVTLRSEAALISDLGGALAAQRSAVASDDLESVEASLDLIGRTLSTLQDIRRTREDQLNDLGIDRGTAISQLSRMCPSNQAPSLERACQAVRAAATQSSREAAMNQAVLQRAIETGEAFLQELFGTVTSDITEYAARPTRHRAVARMGVLVNRSA
ncbi:MAG: flagellar export chaperone FlgN [Gemmatimonadota bacterium]